MITYKWLEGDDLRQLEPILAAHNWMSLNNKTSRALVAEDDGKMVGFFVFQMIPYCGPIFIEKEYRGNGLPTEMTDRMLEWLHSAECRGFIVVADSKFTEYICQAHGLELLGSPVYTQNKPLA